MNIEEQGMTMNKNVKTERYFGRTFNLVNNDFVGNTNTVKRAFSVISVSLFFYFLFGIIGIASNYWIFFVISYLTAIPFIIVLISFARSIINHEKSSYKKFNKATCEKYSLQEDDLINWWNGLSKFGKVSSFTIGGREIEALWTVEDDLITPLLIEINATKILPVTENYESNKMVPKDEEFTKVFNKDK